MHAKVKLSAATVFSDGALFDSTVAPIFKGNGKTDYVCSGCDAVLLKSMDLDDLRRVSDGRFKCPKCGSTSVVAQANHAH